MKFLVFMLFDSAKITTCCQFIDTSKEGPEGLDRKNFFKNDTRYNYNAGPRVSVLLKGYDAGFNLKMCIGSQKVFVWLNS
jgi:hypothetical protein